MPPSIPSPSQKVKGPSAQAGVPFSSSGFPRAATLDPDSGSPPAVQYQDRAEQGKDPGRGVKRFWLHPNHCYCMYICDLSELDPPLCLSYIKACFSPVVPDACWLFIFQTHPSRLRLCNLSSFTKPLLSSLFLLSPRSPLRKFAPALTPFATDNFCS